MLSYLEQTIDTMSQIGLPVITHEGIAGSAHVEACCVQ